MENASQLVLMRSSFRNVLLGVADIAYKFREVGGERRNVRRAHCGVFGGTQTDGRTLLYAFRHRGRESSACPMHLSMWESCTTQVGVSSPVGVMVHTGTSVCVDAILFSK